MVRTTPRTFKGKSQTTKFGVEGSCRPQSLSRRRRGFSAINESRAGEERCGRKKPRLVFVRERKRPRRKVTDGRCRHWKTPPRTDRPQGERARTQLGGEGPTRREKRPLHRKEDGTFPGRVDSRPSLRRTVLLGVPSPVEVHELSRGLVFVCTMLVPQTV